MARTVTICVCCGGGIFTTSVVTEEIEKLLKSKKVPYKIEPHKITEIPNLETDIIVATGKTQATNKSGAPVLIGLPMFKGVGKEEFSQLLLKTIAEVVGE